MTIAERNLAGNSFRSGLTGWSKGILLMSVVSVAHAVAPTTKWFYDGCQGNCFTIDTTYCGDVKGVNNLANAYFDTAQKAIQNCEGRIGLSPYGASWTGSSYLYGGVTNEVWRGYWSDGRYADLFAHGAPKCADGSNPVDGQCVEPVAVEKNLGPCAGESCCLGNPINGGTGNKYQREIDLRTPSLSFVRVYNSTVLPAGIAPAAVGLGSHWRHTYASAVMADPVNPATDVYVLRPEGKGYHFTLSAGVWIPDADVKATLEQLADGAGNPIGWRYTSEDNSVEDFDDNGMLQSYTDVRGSTLTLTYSVASGLLERVDAETGEFLQFGYDAQDRISNLTDHTGRNWRYRYDSVGNLEYVDNPDGTSRRYHYENTNFPQALTGITDERGVRYATFGYDASGRANLSTHAGGAQRVDIVFNTDGTRSVTNSLGQRSAYSTVTQLGVVLVTDVIGPGCSSCGAGNTSYQYDPANNNLLGKTENGVTIQYGNYDSKGQFGYKIESLGTPEERRTDYSYDSRFFNRVTSVTESSVNPR